MKTILEHLKRTMIGAGMLVVCSIGILAVGLPLTYLWIHYPVAIAGIVFLIISWIVGWCRPPKS